MSRFKINQGGKALSNPSQFWVTPKVIDAVVSGSVVPAHFQVTGASAFTAVELFFSSGSHVYRLEGFNPSGNNPNSDWFGDFRSPINLYLPSGKVTGSYKELKALPDFDTLQIRLYRYTWGKFVAANEDGEPVIGLAMLRLSIPFVDAFDEGDDGQPRLLFFGDEIAIGSQNKKVRKIFAQNSDVTVCDLRPEEMTDYVMFFRQYIPGYLSQYFDENGNPTA